MDRLGWFRYRVSVAAAERKIKLQGLDTFVGSVRVHKKRQFLGLGETGEDVRKGEKSEKKWKKEREKESEKKWKNERMKGNERQRKKELKSEKKRNKQTKRKTKHDQARQRKEGWKENEKFEKQEKGF